MQETKLTGNETKLTGNEILIIDDEIEPKTFVPVMLIKDGKKIAYRLYKTRNGVLQLLK
jgi:hypothetical protein